MSRSDITSGLAAWIQAVDVGGASGLVMDISVAPGASRCEHFDTAQVLTQNDTHTGPTYPGLNLDDLSRMRVEPVVASVEFHTAGS